MANDSNMASDCDIASDSNMARHCNKTSIGNMVNDTDSKMVSHGNMICLVKGEITRVSFLSKKNPNDIMFLR